MPGSVDLYYFSPAGGTLKCGELFFRALDGLRRENEFFV